MPIKKKQKKSSSKRKEKTIDDLVNKYSKGLNADIYNDIDKFVITNYVG